MYDDWLLVALIFAVPIILFVILELFGVARSWRQRALATRRKGPKSP